MGQLIERDDIMFDLAILFALDWDEAEYVLPNADSSDWHVYAAGAIVSCKVSDTVYNGSNPCIGAAPSQSLRCRILADPTRIAPRRGAPCWARFDVVASTGQSDRVFYGAYTVDSVSYDIMTNCYDVVATDPMARTDDDYKSFTGNLWSGNVEEALYDVAWTLTQHVPGISAVEGNTDGYLVEYTQNYEGMQTPPDGTTGRDLIQWMAGAVGGNAKIRFNGAYTAPNDAELMIVQHPSGGNNQGTFDIGEDYARARVSFGMGAINGNVQDVSDYIMHVNAVTFENTADGETHRAEGTLAHGTEEFVMRNWLTDPSYAAGVVQYKYNPEIIVNDDEARVFGYIPYTLTQCIIDPRAEAGDRLIFTVHAADGMTYMFMSCVIGTIERDLTLGGIATISAPAPSKTNSVTTSQSTEQLSTNRNKAKTYGGGTTERTATATTDRTGIVKPDGTSITVDRDGTIHGAAAVIATTQRAGIVKPDGTSITVEGDGTIHSAAATIATTQQAGIVKPDGTSVTVDQDGTIHSAAAVIATTQRAGIVKPDGTTVTVDQDGTIHATGGGGSCPYIDEYTPAGGEKGIGIFDPDVSTDDALEHVRYDSNSGYMYLYGLDNIDAGTQTRRRYWSRMSSNGYKDVVYIRPPAPEGETNTGDAYIKAVSGRDTGSVTQADAGSVEAYATNGASEVDFRLAPGESARGGSHGHAVLDVAGTVGSNKVHTGIQVEPRLIEMFVRDPDGGTHDPEAYFTLNSGTVTLEGGSGTTASGTAYHIALTMNNGNVILKYNDTHYIKVGRNGVYVNDGNGERLI
jgi:hypothetical protein